MEVVPGKASGLQGSAPPVLLLRMVPLLPLSPMALHRAKTPQDGED